MLMGLDTPILRSAQATTVPRRGTETMTIGRRPPSSRSAAGVSQRFAASSELDTNGTRPIGELQPNSTATSPDHSGTDEGESVRDVGSLGLSSSAGTALLGYDGRRPVTIVDAVPRVTHDEQPHDPTAADDCQLDRVTRHQGARDRRLVPNLSAGVEEVRQTDGSLNSVTNRDACDLGFPWS